MPHHRDWCRRGLTCIGPTLQGKTIEQFDHVQRGLTLDDDEEEDPSKASNLRNMTDDMKRALGALQVRVAGSPTPPFLSMLSSTPVLRFTLLI
jgi:hypothetical protein